MGDAAAVRRYYRPSLQERTEDALWLLFCLIAGAITCGVAVIVVCVAWTAVGETRW